MISNSTSDDIFDFLLQGADAHFSGWDFSTIDGRESQAPLRWSYVSEALCWVRKASCVLDMDTGGGEVFSRFAPFPPLAFATEAYEPNIPIACKRLEPLGVVVIPLEDEEPMNLPFKTDYFDLILNRHGYYYAPEIYRITQPGGIFLTQQVGNQNDIGIRRLLGAPDSVVVEEGDDLGSAAAHMRQQGFQILKQLEDIYLQRFYDIGAIIYQLKAIPWQIPDFTVERYFTRLKAVHEQIQRVGYVDVQEHRFFFIAKKPD